ncbi:MAG TPA: aldo/keto reductase [Bryobacteraceae bacterium]|nr:aldo/keto reductase [Bryobacteraceae bacterium]
MRTRTLGQSGIEASTVAFGAWAIGGWMWGGAEEQESIRAVEAALDCGMTFIDTAPAYGLGLSEEIVGRAVRGRREKAVIATKCGMVWHTTRGTFFLEQDGKPVHRYLGRESVIYECEHSLKRLGTDYIDLYQTHWQDLTTPIEETMSALLQLKQEGKIRAIGVSNATPAQVREYLSFGPVDTDQERYSLIDRKQEPEMIPLCIANNIAFLAYSPLANGLLTGRIGPERTFKEGDLRKGSKRFGQDNLARVTAAFELLKPIYERHTITPGQLVIAATLAQPGVTHALVGARSRAQVEENVKAAEVRLTEQEVAEVVGAFEGIR